VRTLAIGTVEADTEGVPDTRELAYFSRLCSAAAFIDWVAMPLHTAGTVWAGAVVAIQDGAD
jgi:hypothetical protein